ncbi:MAG: hypothetical protein E4H09_04880 [Spirochaetales bacterium]|nr:MAG: hypothetical protein E4H09_04880 [Spirochaetales bacterium]
MRNLTRIPLSVAFLIITISTATAQSDNPDHLLVSRALAVSPEYTMPVLKDDGSPVSVFFDFNGDTLTDVAILTVTREQDVSDRMAVLSERVRIYAPPATIPLFVLEPYFQNDAAIQTVELGRFPVVSSMDLLSVSRTEPYPVAIRVETRSQEGSTAELLIHDGTGRVSRFRAANTRNRRSLIEDIDRDGTLDIIVMSQFPEAGRGYETFMERYEFQKAGVVGIGAFPLVRELATFLSAVEEAMRRGDWEFVLEQVDAGMIGETQGTEILRQVFLELAEDDLIVSTPPGFDLDQSGEAIDSVTFPDFLANPFPDPVLGASIRVVFRVDIPEQVYRYFAASVRLEQDPFTGRRFAFLTDTLSGR